MNQIDNKQFNIDQFNEELYYLNETMELANFEILRPKKFIDCSVWAGGWPFYYLRYGKLKTLKEGLAKYNVSKAFVSPIDAILEADPIRADLVLFDEIDRFEMLQKEFICGNETIYKFFSPVPVVDLSMQNWTDVIDFSILRNDVKIVKLLPNYHMYELTETNMGNLIEYIEYTSKSGMIISIQMRIEDTRRHHPLMKVPDVDLIKLIKVLSYFPQQKFIVSNGYLGEVSEVLYSLENTYVDISSVEAEDALLSLSFWIKKGRVLFSTHSAFYYPEGNIFKVAYSGLDEECMNKISYKNAAELLI